MDYPLIQCGGLVLIAGWLWFIRYLVRRRRLKVSYSILWIFMALVMAALAVFPTTIYYAGSLLGLYYKPAVFFLLAGLCCVAILFHVSTVISSLSRQNVSLMQELALLKHKLDMLESRASSDRHE